MASTRKCEVCKAAKIKARARQCFECQQEANDLALAHDLSYGQALAILARDKGRTEAEIKVASTNDLGECE